MTERITKWTIGAATLELDYTKQPSRRVDQDPWAESVQPILNAGLSVETSADHDLGDGFRLIATPGHASLVVDAGATELVITGDLIDHPFQCACPDVAQGSDWDAEMARATRHDFLGRYSGRDAVVAGTHFPGNPLGRIEAVGHSWRFRPVDPDGG